MPKFIYVGDADRDYPTLRGRARSPEPGATYSLRKAPHDGRWTDETGNPVTPPTDETPDDASVDDAPVTADDVEDVDDNLADPAATTPAEES